MQHWKTVLYVKKVYHPQNLQQKPEMGTLKILLTGFQMKSAATALHARLLSQSFAGSTTVGAVARSSVPAVPPTLLHYLVMARWSLSVFALTVTCSMSLLSIVTELVSDILNYWCGFWSLTWTDIFDLSQELTWKGLERGTQWGHVGFDIHYYKFCTDNFYCILLSC